MKKRLFYILPTIGAVLLLLVFYIHYNINALHTLTQDDPLFYFPGPGSDNLSEYVSFLKDQEHGVLNTLEVQYKHGEVSTPLTEEEMGVLLRDGFLPTTYLEALTRAHNATKNFLEKSTLISALQMIKYDRDAARVYKEDAKHLLEMHQPHVTETYFQNIGTRVWNKTVQSDLELIFTNGIALESETNKRIWCIILPCTPPSYTPYIPLAATVSTAPTSTITSPLSTELMEESVASYGSFYLKNTCFPSKENIFDVYLHDTYGFLPKDREKDYLLDMNVMHASEHTRAYAESFIEKDVLYREQLEGASYRCPDYRYWGVLSLSIYEPTEETEIDARIVKQNNLAHLGAMLQNIGAFLTPYKEEAADYGADTTYLLGVRTAYPITFQTFSRSTWRIQENPRYLDSANNPLPSLYTTH